MASIDSKKLLPPSKKSSSIEKQKFLVPIKNISTKKIAGSDLKPIDRKTETSGSLVVVKNKIVKLDKLIENNLLLDQNERSRKRKEDERSKAEKRESDIEKKVKKNNIKFDFISSIPGKSIFDRINRFIGFTLLGYLFNKYGELLPKLMEFGKVLKPVGEFVESFAKNLLKGTVDFIEFGYKTYDQTRDFVKKIGGEGAEKTFDEFSKNLNILLNGAIGVSMLIASTSPKKSQTLAAKARIPGGKKSPKITFGHDTPAPKINPRSFATGVAELGIGVLGDIAIQKLGGSLNQSIISNKINEAKKLSPQDRKKYIEKLNNQLKREKDYQASLLFSLDKIKDLGGETQSEKLTTTLLAILDGLGEKPKYAEGGKVSRSNQSIVAPSRRIHTTTKKSPTKIQPQKTQPGKDVGGKLKIEELYGTDEPGKRSALRALKRSSEDVKKMKSINGLTGSMFGAGIDMALGQKPDKNLSRNLGNIFGSVVASAVDMELNNSFSDISKTIAMANGGVVPSREIGSGLSIGERIGNFISRALAVSIESSASKILQNLRNEMNLKGSDKQEYDPFATGPSGGGGGPEIPNNKVIADANEFRKAFPLPSGTPKSSMEPYELQMRENLMLYHAGVGNDPTVDPVHTPGSSHYSQEAIDIPVNSRSNANKVINWWKSKGYAVLDEYDSRGHIHVSWRNPVATRPTTQNVTPTGQELSGQISWYGPDFYGGRTASGKPFRSDSYVAAHKTLPFGTLLKVTWNGRSIVVPVEDRGPFKPGRVLDLSEAAARDLGMIGAGVINNAKIEIVKQKSTKPRKSIQQPEQRQASLAPSQPSSSSVAFAKGKTIKTDTSITVYDNNMIAILPIEVGSAIA